MSKNKAIRQDVLSRDAWRRDFNTLATAITGGKGVAAIDEAHRLRRADAGIRNIIYNVEQNPAQYTVQELLENMRRAIGVLPNERV